MPFPYNSSGRTFQEPCPRLLSCLSATGIDMMLDRAIRAEANILLCGRSGLAFEYQLQPNFINNLATTIDFQEPPATVSATARRAMESGIMWGDSAI